MSVEIRLCDLKAVIIGFNITTDNLDILRNIPGYKWIADTESPFLIFTRCAVSFLTQIIILFPNLLIGLLVSRAS